MNSLYRLACVLFLLIFITACGNTAPPAVVQPTVAPTEAPAFSVNMDQPWRYQHSSGLFAIDVPRGWSATETSTAEELIVRFTDESTNAAMLTNVLTVTRQLDSSGLDALLRAHLQASYGSEPTFAQEPPKTQPDGSQLIVWGYNAPLPDGTTARLLGNSFIEQHGSLVSLLTVVVPSDEYPRLRPQIDATLNSYKVRGETTGMASVNELRDVDIRALEPYTSTNDLFRIDVPTGWMLELPQAEGRVLATWSDPSQNGWLMVQVLADDSQRSRKELSALMTGVISDALGTERDFAIEVPETPPDGMATVTWRYTATANNGVSMPMAGTGIGMQRGEKVALLSVNLPASQQDALQPQIDAVFASFILNEAAPNP